MRGEIRSTTSAPVVNVGPQPPNPPSSLRDKLRIGLGLLVYHLTAWMLSHPAPLRPMLALLRWLRPISVVRGTVIAAKGADAREVLSRFEDFTLGEVLTPRMPWGPFLLTIDWRDQHDRERALFESMVARAPDIARIRAITQDVCATAIAGARFSFTGRHEIDVVRELCEPVVVRIAADYFGIPTVRDDAGHMAHILREIAGIAMVSPPAGSRRDQVAKEAIAELKDHVIATMAHEAGSVIPAPLAPAVPGTSLLIRLLTAARATNKPAWLDDDFVRRYVMGLAATGGATIVRASTNAIGELLKRPHALRHARAVALGLDEAARAAATAPSADRAEAERTLATRRDELRQMLYEALRFRPMLPLLVRYTPRETLLAKGTPRQRVIPAGSTVIAGPMAVMFDPEEFEAPGEFISSRPLDTFVHFGFGPRTCFGRYVADTAMLEIFAAVVKLPDVALGEGSSGRVAYDGPVANSLTVSFAQIDRDRFEPT